MTRPPTTSTRPVPTRLRMPSASVMTRESSAPTLFWSKKETESRPMCRWTARRISVIERCAALPRTWDRAKDVTAWMRVAAPEMSTSRPSSCRWPLPMTSSRRNLVVPGRTSPATRFTRRRREPQGEAAPPGDDELPGVLHDDGERGRLLLLAGLPRPPPLASCRAGPRARETCRRRGFRVAPWSAAGF